MTNTLVYREMVEMVDREGYSFNDYLQDRTLYSEDQTPEVLLKEYRLWRSRQYKEEGEVY